MIWSSELAEGNVGRLQFQQGLPNRPSYCARPLSVRDLVKKGRTALLPLNSSTYTELAPGARSLAAELAARRRSLARHPSSALAAPSAP